MRRSIAAAVVALSTALPVMTAGTSSATDDTSIPSVLSSAGRLAEQRADRALTRAQEVLSTPVGSTPGKPDATLAMRDLALSLSDLDPSQRRKAHAVLARPTDGNDDAYGDGYTVPSKRKCRGNFCIHWVTSTSDAATAAWADRTLTLMNSVWKHHVDDMGYRRPVGDGSRGGNGKFDVYLKDLGSKSLYGYCAPENPKAGYKYVYSGYCVLDNDFSRQQYGAPPVDSLTVTAAHEFFHAVQFAYDASEDSWLMEATATWMEERYADSINDNRQYLPYGQVKRPGSPLDFANSTSFNQYGNWPFFEYLSTHFGNRVVRAIWNQAGAFKGAPDLYSTRAIKKVLRDHGGFVRVFRAYAAGNTIPARTYPEGAAWPSAAIAKRLTLSRSHKLGSASFTIDHLASANASVKPDTSLEGRQWRARITVDGPGRRTSPAAYLTIRKKHGKVDRVAVPLGKRGNGRVTVPFSASDVRSVTVTLANASTRFSNCWSNTAYSCQGRPTDTDEPFTLKVAAYRS